MTWKNFTEAVMFTFQGRAHVQLLLAAVSTPIFLPSQGYKAEDLKNAGWHSVAVTTTPYDPTAFHAAMHVFRQPSNQWLVDTAMVFTRTADVI